MFISTPLSPSCEEGVLNPLPSPRPFQKGKGCNRPTRCSEPLRYKVGGASKPSPYCAGWDRLGYTLIGKVCTFFELLQYSILFYLVLYLFLRTTCPAKNFLSFLFPLRQLRLSEICFPDVFPLIVIQ